MLATSLLAGVACSSDPDPEGEDETLADVTSDVTDRDTADAADDTDPAGADSGDTNRGDGTSDGGGDLDPDATSDTSPDGTTPDTDAGPDCETDSDQDGLNDCEERELCTDPHDGDTDDDHLGDLEEIQNQTDPCSADTDDDGVPDNRELELGLDPNRSSSYEEPAKLDSERWFVDHCQTEGAESEDVDFYTNHTGNWQIALPTSFNYYPLSAGLTEPEAAAAYDDPANEVSGALVSVESPAHQASPRDALEGPIDQAVRDLVAEVDYDPLQATFTTHNNKRAAIREYEVELSDDQAMSQRRFREEVMFAITPSRISRDKIDDGLPPSAGRQTTEFRLEISVTRRNHVSGEETNLVSLAVAPLEQYNNLDKVQFRVDDMTNTTTVSDAQDAVQTDCTLQKPDEQQPRAEFYWLFDPSGSMNEEAELVRNFGGDFVEAIENTQLDYRLGVSNTDANNNGRLRNPPAWHTPANPSDPSTFTNEIREVGAENCSSPLSCYGEHGIEAATLGLQYMMSGSAPPAEQIRSGANVFTLILSDERAQGDWESEDSSRNDNPKAQFLTDNSTVFAMTAETEGHDGDCSPLSPEPTGYYAHVANKSGGAHTDLCSERLTQFLEEIIRLATGRASNFTLPETPISSSLRVYLDDRWIPRSTENGFDYYPSTNTIAFFGNHRPDLNPDEGEQPDWFAVSYQAYDTRCKDAQNRDGVDTCPVEDAEDQ